MGNGPFLQLPRFSTRQNKDLAIFFCPRGRPEIIRQTAFKVGNKLHVLTADSEAEAVHGQIAQHRQTCFIEKADTGRQVIKSFLNRGIADGLAVFGFAKQHPKDKCQGQQYDQQQQYIRNVQMQALIRSGDPAVQLHDNIERCIEQEHSPHADLLWQPASAFKQQNNPRRKRGNRKLTKHQQNDLLHGACLIKTGHHLPSPPSSLKETV